MGTLFSELHMFSVCVGAAYSLLMFLFGALVGECVKRYRKRHKLDS